MCSKPGGARGIEPETFQRRGQLLSCPPTTGPKVGPSCSCFLSCVFLGGARRLEISPCNTIPFFVIFSRVYCIGVWFGFVGSALLLAVVLCWVDCWFDSWVLLGLLRFLHVTPTKKIGYHARHRRVSATVPPHRGGHVQNRAGTGSSAGADTEPNRRRSNQEWTDDHARRRRFANMDADGGRRHAADDTQRTHAATRARH